MFPGVSFRIENGWVLVTLLGVFLFGAGLLYPVSSRSEYMKKSAQAVANQDKLRTETENLGRKEYDNLIELHPFGLEIMKLMEAQKVTDLGQLKGVPKSVLEGLSKHGDIAQQYEEERAELRKKGGDVIAEFNGLIAERDIANSARGLGLVGLAIGGLCTVVGGYGWYRHSKKDTKVGIDRLLRTRRPQAAFCLAACGILVVSLSQFAPRLQAYRCERKSIEGQIQASDLIRRVRPYVPKPEDFDLHLMSDIPGSGILEKLRGERFESIIRAMEESGPEGIDAANRTRYLWTTLESVDDLKRSEQWLTDWMWWFCALGVFLTGIAALVQFTGIQIKLRR